VYLCAYFAVEQMGRARSVTYTSTPENVLGNLFENSSRLDAYVTLSTSELVILQEKWMAAANESELQVTGNTSLLYMRALCIALMLLFSNYTHTLTH
jgi:hypothetical protein